MTQQEDLFSILDGLNSSSDVNSNIESDNHQLNENNDNKELTQNEKIKIKREKLFNYAINPNSTDEEFDNIISEYGDDVSYTMSEALELSQSNFTIYDKLNDITNNFDVYYNRKIAPYILKYTKNHNPLKIQLNRINQFQNNPYYRQGITNKEFNVIWKLLLERFPELKNSDKDLICRNYSIEELKIEAGYNNDQIKEKVKDNEESFSLDLSIPKTKGELFSYWSNLALIFNNSNKNVFGNITVNNMNDLLSDIKIAFIALKPNENDFSSNILYYNSNEFNNILQCLEIVESKDFIALNICNRYEDLQNNDLDHIASCFENIIDKVIDTLPKDCILMPINQETIDVLGFDNKSLYYKYKKHLVWPCIDMIKDDKYSLKLILQNQQKKPSVKRDNSFNLENILISIRNYKNQVIQNNIAPNKYNFVQNIQLNDLMTKHNKILSYQQLNNELSKLNKYNIVYTSRTLYTNKSGITDKRGTPYVCLRNGEDKKIYYINSTLDIGYSINPDAKVEEPYNDNTRLNIISNVPYDQLFKIKHDIKQRCNNTVPVFYNTDFAISIYINSEIRNRMKYEEGNNSPRIVVMDFETEKEAIRVKPTDKAINAKCRLASLFDILTKTFYCAILKDPNHHTDEVINQIKNKHVHDGYNIIVEIFDNEVSLWNWFIEQLINLDPDILTGWNMESFDCTFAIVRCNTLGIKFRNKYSDFQFIKYKDNSYIVGVDGCVILDYEKLYKKNKPKKQENYTLEYICQQELKHGKREKVVEDHDIMYYDYLYEYFLYNLEDNERIYDLENKTNYIKFRHQMCDVCNISWDDIYSQIKHIDGLVYNYAWDNHKTLLNDKRYEHGSSNIKQTMLSDLIKYCDLNNVDLIANGSISLRKYINDLEHEINSAPKDSKGYEGAVVLAPQMGAHYIVADLDASQMYPRLMIRSNIFADTLCGIIAFDNENMAEKWLYDRDNFPSEILIKEHNKVDNKMLRLSKDEFEDYLKDKILTPFGTIYIKPSVNRSLISNLLIFLIGNRTKYKNLLKEQLVKIDELKNNKSDDMMRDAEILEATKLAERYDNLQTAYKSLINSFYGVMGQEGCRLANIYSAASITASGRELTRMVSYYSSKYIDYMIKQNRIDVPFEDIPINIKSLVGLESIENRKNVIYGDTDSAFLLIGKVVKHLYKNDTELKDQIDHAWVIIERISQFINQYVIKDILTRKNIDFYDDDKDYNYEYKKEIVASKVLFGDSKKQYAMRMMLREGKPVDNIDIKGMVTIKSDTSRMSRELGNKIIHYILTDYDVENISASNKHIMDMYNEAVEKVNRLIDKGDLSIGTPSSLVSDLSAYKTFQSSSRGMLLYDTIFEDHEYVAQDKGYQFYISDINWDKLKTTPEEIKDRFRRKYSKYEWYNNVMRTCTDELLFSSITIPVDSDRLDTDIFTINRKEVVTNVVKEKVKKLLALVGINRIDEDDDKKLKKTIIKKIDSVDSILDDFNFKI